MTYLAFRPPGTSVVSFLRNPDPERPYQLCGVKGAVYHDGIPGLRSDTYPMSQLQAVAHLAEVAAMLAADGVDVNAALRNLAESRQRAALLNGGPR
jgi:hypothetical protein